MRCILFVFTGLIGLADLGAQARAEDGIPLVVAGVLRALEYVAEAEEQKGATFDLSLSWESFADDPDACRLVFSDFRYLYRFDSGNGRYSRVVLNGKLRRDASGRLNGRLSVGGDTGLSSFSFDNLSAWEGSETGGITAGGVSYTQAEVTEIIDSMDYNFDTSNVIPWELECIYAGMLVLQKSSTLEWGDGEGVLESLEDLPPEGSRVRGEDGKISAAVKNGGIEFSYRDCPVDAGDEYFSFTAGGDVRISAKWPKNGDALESLTFSGSLELKGIPAFSRVKLNGFTIRIAEEDGDDVVSGSGSALIDGKEYPASEILDSAMRYFH
ncbi:MAG: hypothetical protein LBT33_04635 [Spirochaetia bacterium]|nr:hypothetical protein [Spirochaetia bacterium]